ncbi:hypothetical protein C1646_767247 [Rhizophagus diaphanus]|nr:hypothetical protein C1646_767247 [Rhizophagus diaphanus] [Rhizophagus sp. MUCL 43196]
MENYKHTQEDNGLDPSHYVPASEMFNNSLYKSSEAELKLMTDMDEYLMVENGIHEEIIMAKILGKVGPKEIPDIQSIAPDAEIGYMLEVDLKALVHLYDFFSAPEKQIVPENWLSLYNERLVHNKEVEGEKYVSREKLVQTLTGNQFQSWIPNPIESVPKLDTKSYRKSGIGYNESHRELAPSWIPNPIGQFQNFFFETIKKMLNGYNESHRESVITNPIGNRL